MPLPVILLGAYGVAFAWTAIGASLPAFDDHPGQLYRAWHVVDHGPAPWAWNDGWWTGYPELQFYPPAFSYAVALLHAVSLGTLPVAAAYTLMVWVSYLAPGVATLLALARVLGNAWAALPGAFVALTLSAGVASGVEGGVHIGMLPARLGWALLPLLLLTLAGPSDAPPRVRWVAAPVLAALVLTHPAHAPAAVVLLALAAGASLHGRRSLLTAVVVVALAGGLTAFWSLPLAAHLAETRALAWGHLSATSVLETFTTHPLAVALVLLAPLAFRVRSRLARVVALWPWATALAVALDAALLERLGVRWLPSDRVSDSAWLAFIVAAGAGIGGLLARGRPGVPAPAASPRAWAVPAGALAAVAAIVLLSLPGSTLTLWPRAGSWPSYELTARGLRLDEFWDVLRAAPAGRVLFVRSGVPLVHGTQWWRPHTHVTALTPLMADRPIVNGTFTHPSPVAAAVYRGDAGPGPITRLVERLDGETLFGRPLSDVDAATLDSHADRLGVAAVVALEDDRPRLTALEESTRFRPAAAPAPFVLYVRPVAAALPEPVAPGRWRVALEGAPQEWVAASLAYYPLWRAEADGVVLPVRRGELGQLEVQLPGSRATVDLIYEPGAVEWMGIVVSAAALAAMAGLTVRGARRRSGTRYRAVVTAET